MTATLEFRAKNVDKAVEKASAELNVPKKNLKYEILSYGSSGIFGLSSAKKAKIRVRLPKDPRPLETKPEISEFESDLADVPESPESSDELNLGDDDTVAKVNQEGQQLFSFPEDPVDIGRLVLQRIVDAITTDAKISVERDSERIFFNVNGGNAGILIGKRGQTLDAIQSIVEKVVNKHRENRTRVFVDIEGYLESRKENLEKLAVRLAEKSKSTGKPMSLGEMNAYDRRIVHIALKENPDVQTRSRGEGPLRKLVIFPKKRSSSKS
ncbi:MAG: Jag N-terminal domain-containing protein [Desulfobacterales bacterium]|jgi:spoIIIJ-associated protein|nr:Jag N-terminal domain-containing protein [Desulfobacterales bacterium]